MNQKTGGASGKLRTCPVQKPWAQKVDHEKLSYHPTYSENHPQQRMQVPNPCYELTFSEQLRRQLGCVRLPISAKKWNVFHSRTKKCSILHLSVTGWSLCQLRFCGRRQAADISFLFFFHISRQASINIIIQLYLLSFWAHRYIFNRSFI